MNTKTRQPVDNLKTLLIKSKQASLKLFVAVSSFAKKHFTRKEAFFFAIMLLLSFFDQFTARYTALTNTSVANTIISFFTFSDPFFMKDVLCWAALMMLPLLLMGRFSRYIYIPVIFLTAISDSVIIFAWSNFNLYLDGDWVGIVLASNPEELSVFLKTYAFSILSFLILLIATAFFCLSFIVVCKLKTSKVSWTRSAIAVMTALLFCIAMPIPNAFTNSPMCRFTANTIKEFTHYRRLAKLKKNPEIPDVNISGNNMVLGVFILGESATRNHWSLYGYPKKTTPRMDELRDELFIFQDLVTPVSNTAKAMELIFTQSSIEEPNNPKCTYAQMLKKAGYDVSHYSSQSRWGKWDGVESFIFSGADPLVFIEEENIADNEWHDDVLLKYLENDISSRTNHAVTILHLDGSHYPAAAHYPSKNRPLELETFILENAGPNAATNEYDNSIFFTDMLLGATIDKLKKRGGFSWMIYISDHGDSIGANSFRLTNDRNVWEVPMIVWLSEDYKKIHPEIVKELENSVRKPLQSDLLLPGFLRIAGASGWHVGTEKDFLNEKFKPRSPRIIEGGRVNYSWETINKTESDPGKPESPEK